MPYRDARGTTFDLLDHQVNRQIDRQMSFTSWRLNAAFPWLLSTDFLFKGSF